MLIQNLLANNIFCGASQNAVSMWEPNVTNIFWVLRSIRKATMMLPIINHTF